MSKLQVDYRVGGNPRYYLADDNRRSMQIPDEVRKCAAFLCINTDEGQKVGATVFFVSMDDPDTTVKLHYVVTARHNIAEAQKESSDGKLLLRLNKKDGTWDHIETHLDEWTPHTDSFVDVAVRPFEPQQKTYDYEPIPLTGKRPMQLTDGIIEERHIAVGDDVFLAGLFAEHYGKERNLPIVRTGTIALMREEEVEIRPHHKIDAYLVECRSHGGLSGSPVFVYPGICRIYNYDDRQADNDDDPWSVHCAEIHRLYYWMGLVQGHYGEESDEDEQQAQELNKGIAFVVPWEKVLEVLNLTELEEMRKEDIKKKRQPIRTVLDSGFQGQTKKDFEETLKQVSRPIEPSRPSKAKS